MRGHGRQILQILQISQSMVHVRLIAGGHQKMQKKMAAMMPIMAQGRKYDPFLDCATEIEGAKHGRITPEEAELQAKGRGLGPLAVPLKHFQLDHPKLAVWTMEMTAAWIEWKDSARVLRHYEPSYACARQWVPNTYVYPPERKPAFGKLENGRSGHDLKVFGPANIRDDFLDVNGRSTSFDRERSWRDSLYRELVAGRIRASGELCAEEWAEEKGYSEQRSDFEKARLKMMVDFVTETGERGRGIPGALWRHLTTDVSRGETVLRYQNAVLFRCVRLSSEEVLGAFPSDAKSTDEYGRSKLIWQYREPQTISGEMSIAVAAWIRATHANGFPRTSPMVGEVRKIIEKRDVDNQWGFDEKSDDSFRKFVRRLMEKLLDDEYSAHVPQ